MFLQVEINHAGEIDEIFDAISYRKGASVIRMLQNYLGADCFQVNTWSNFFKKQCIFLIKFSQSIKQGPKMIICIRMSYKLHSEVMI